MKNYMTNSQKIYKFILQSISTSSTLVKLPDHLNSDLIFQAALKNNLFLAVAEKLNRESLPGNFGSKYYYHKKIAETSVMLIDHFMEACNENELPLLTIKSFLPFPFIDTNIDIVAVDLKNLSKYQKIIDQLGYVRVRNLADLREPDKAMYAKSKTKESTYELCPKLHLHRRISWNGITYLNLGNVWQRHQYRTILQHKIKIPVPSTEDELLIIAAHALFENKYITLCDLAHLNWIFNQDLDWEYADKAAKEYNWSPGFFKFISTALLLLKTMGFDFDIEPKLPSPIKTRFDYSPILLPPAKTLNITLNKMLNDLMNKEIKKIPWELFSYLFVETIWMYYKALKKQVKF